MRPPLRNVSRLTTSTAMPSDAPLICEAGHLPIGAAGARRMVRVSQRRMDRLDRPPIQRPFFGQARDAGAQRGELAWAGLERMDLCEHPVMRPDESLDAVADERAGIDVDFLLASAKARQAEILILLEHGLAGAGVAGEHRHQHGAQHRLRAIVGQDAIVNFAKLREARSNVPRVIGHMRDGEPGQHLGHRRHRMTGGDEQEVRPGRGELARGMHRQAFGAGAVQCGVGVVAGHELDAALLELRQRPAAEKSQPVETGRDLAAGEPIRNGAQRVVGRRLQGAKARDHGARRSSGMA